MRQIKTLPEMQELADQIGEFIHYWGFKRVHGRIWARLFLAQKPMDAAELVSALNISKALISISLRELMEYDVVQDVGKSTRGTNLYRTNPNIMNVILNVLRQREKKMLSQIYAAYESVERLPDLEKNDMAVSPERLKLLGGMIGNAMTALDGLIAIKNVDVSQFQNFMNIPMEDLLCVVGGTGLGDGSGNGSADGGAGGSSSGSPDGSVAGTGAAMSGAHLQSFANVLSSLVNAQNSSLADDTYGLTAHDEKRSAGNGQPSSLSHQPVLKDEPKPETAASGEPENDLLPASPHQLAHGFARSSPHLPGMTYRR